MRQDNAVPHFARRTRRVVVERRLQDLVQGDKVGQLGRGGKDRVEEATSQLCALSV